ncbi:DNA-binding domain-containing protein [Odoribacter lunatus]|uniref:DNA-binding domain-containing protein n=1 Tax=Odoribacter lunatus TaxID=2941335 RepID=UPI00203B2C02|nr:DNA-binding domain-containing protein [Odoribacter lunatus]
MTKKTSFWSGWLQDNAVTEDPNDFYFQVKSSKMFTTEDVAKALQAEGTEFKLETLVDILNRGDRIIRNALLAGTSVGTGVFYAYPSVSGTWYGKDDTFDDTKHKVGVNFQLSASLREGLKAVGVEVLGLAETGPAVSTVTDHWTGEVNGVITPQEDLIVKGRCLRVDGDKEGVGIRFVRVDDGTETPVEIRRLTVNNPSQLQFRIPALQPGDYWLEVTTQYSQGSVLTKEPRTVRFRKVLNVAVPEAAQEG